MKSLLLFFEIINFVLLHKKVSVHKKVEKRNFVGLKMRLMILFLFILSFVGTQDAVKNIKVVFILKKASHLLLFVLLECKASLLRK